MRKKAILALATILIFSGATLWGCSDNPPASAAKGEPQALAAKALSDPKAPSSEEIPLTILKAPFPDEPTAPSIFLVGQKLGIFQKHHIDFDYVGAIPSTQLVASVVSGHIDVSHGAHINRTIAGISAGAKILAVAGNSETTERFPHMIGVVRKDSPLRKPEDFIGKKIGISLVGGCHEYTPYAWLTKNGVKDPKNKVTIIVLSRNALEQALRQGEIDLAMLHKMPEEMERKGEFDVIFSDYDVWGPNGGATPPYFATKFIQEKPEVVKEFVAAVAETINWSNANPYGAREITARGTNYDVNLVNQRYFTPDGIIKPITAEVWIDLLVEFGEIKPGIQLEQIYTNEFNPFNKAAS
ncbi:MAG: ABC transporter substrate-binding protein [Deltaproteobacteria bacterium]|jgi:ABC-type nitrate/sulfonate/bicarbonate transport system substrate-binding protein|nr:ABC transporter substrate-binding protein [Deltaproteobacteria bacterium]